jgi:hypothetical protein
MALIEVYHTIASNFLVNGNTSAIKEGMGVTLLAGDNVPSVKRKDSAAQVCIGIAGDSKSSTGPNKPYGASVVVSGTGTVVATQNRVSDMFNETTASGKVTVYHGVGEFFTDQWDTALATGVWAVGGALYVNASGLITMTSGGNGNQIGRLLAAPAPYPSGVPGGFDDPSSTVDSRVVDGSTSLGSFIHFAMNVQ